MTSSAQQTAFVVSLVLHGALAMWVEVRADERAPSPRATAVHDAWSGDGIEVEAHPPGESPPERATPPAVADEVTAASNEAASTRGAPRAVTSDTVVEPTQRARRVKAVSSVKAAVAAPSSPAIPDTSAAGSAVTPPAAAFGAAALPPGVRHLPRAFARAVALANRGDAAWRTLPPGLVGEASVALPIETNGALGALTFDDARERDHLLPAVRRMLDNTVLLLASGRFSLDSRVLAGGVMRVRVRVEILEQSALSDPDVDPNELNAIDYEPPQAGKPGHGAFLLNSGRRVICWVTPLGRAGIAGRAPGADVLD